MDLNSRTEKKWKKTENRLKTLNFLPMYTHTEPYLRIIPWCNPCVRDTGWAPNNGRRWQMGRGAPITLEVS